MRRFLIAQSLVVLGLSTDAFGGLPLDTKYFEGEAHRHAPTVSEVLDSDGQDSDKAVAFLTSLQRKFVQNKSSGNPEEAAVQGAGFSFPASSPWITFIGRYVASITTKDFRPIMGDWGCGHGFTSLVVLMGGGCPYGLELNKDVAKEANSLLAQSKPYLAKDRKLGNSYKMFVGSVLKPPSEFMDRLNDINICCNVIHFMPPEAADELLENLWKNTAEGGILYITAFTPEGHSPADPSVIQSYYAANEKRGEKYPGFGIYTMSGMQSLDGQSSGNVTRYISRPSPKDLKRLSIGKQYIGPHRAAPLESDKGQTITIRKACEQGLGPEFESFIPYVYSTEHMMMNLFRPEALAKAVESKGFRVINSWFTADLSDVLTSTSVPIPPEVYGQVAVVVAQKAF